jgi:hypothetical protein
VEEILLSAIEWTEDQILAEPIEAGGGNIILCNYICNKEEELPDHWKESVIVLIYKKGDESDCIITKECHS